MRFGHRYCESTASRDTYFEGPVYFGELTLLPSLESMMGTILFTGVVVFIFYYVLGPLYCASEINEA